MHASPHFHHHHGDHGDREDRGERRDRSWRRDESGAADREHSWRGDPGRSRSRRGGRPGGPLAAAVFGLVGAARAAAGADEPARARIEAILVEARRAIFAVLAEPTSSEPSEQESTESPAPAAEGVR